MRKVAPILFLLLIAALLRLALLDAIPPGLTHDEANHGREALGVLDGDFRYYFPYNYGSEPLYSYTAAGVMGLVGGHIFGLRLATAWAGLLAVAATFAVGRRLLGRPAALLGAGTMAVSFWPVAASREALRAGLLPLIAAVAVYLLWQLLTAARRGENRPVLPVLLLVLAIAAAFHDYLAARVWWLLFPAFFLYLLLRARFLGLERTTVRRLTPPFLAAAALAGLAVTPMFVYLERHPEMQPRVAMLDGTLQALRAGDLAPLFSNARDALLAFAVSGYGDTFLAYNLPGKPLFDPLTALLFALGIATCVWRWRRPGGALLLLWFGAGIAPSLITGPTANTTRNAAALPAIYLLVGAGFVTVFHVLSRSSSFRVRAPQLAVVWLGVIGLLTARDYFTTWGQLPEVRAAYMHTLVEALPYLERTTPVVMSSPLPGPAHDISVAMTALGNNELTWRAIDARTAMIFPGGAATTVYVPASTPPHPSFGPWLTPREAVTLRPDDLIPGFTLFEGQPPTGVTDSGAAHGGVNFNGAVELLEARWLAESVPPGGVAEFYTRWIVRDPARVGPIVLPALTSDVVFFTHVLRTDGTILVQRDALDAPSWSWRTGDVIIQIHQIYVPPDVALGTYGAQVGIYDRASGARLPLLGPAGSPTGRDTAPVPALEVAP